MNLKDDVVRDVVEGISKIAVPEPMITDADVADIKSVLLPGDCIVCRREYEVSNEVEEVLEDSFYGHAAIYLGGPIPVFESVTKDGFRNISLERLLYTKDAIGVCRVPGFKFTDSDIAMMRVFAATMRGWKYNYAMDWNIVGEVYCSEAVVKMWQAVHPDIISVLKGTHFIGQLQISPQNLWDSCVQVKTWGVTK